MKNDLNTEVKNEVPRGNGLLDLFWSVFATGQDKPPCSDDPGVITKTFNKFRWQVFSSITFGYALFYVLRLNFSVIKKPLMAAGILNAQQLGIMGSVFFITYGLGKFVNSFLADRMNNKRFFALGLFLSSIITVLMGFCNEFVPLVVLWGINGWFQSFGAGPCIVSLNQWFSNKERGTFYGIWFTSHNLGAAFTYVATATIVSAYSWKLGFIIPGIFCLVGSILIYFFMHDRPETYGLPNVADFKNDHAAVVEKDKSVGALQWSVVKRPAVWILGLSSLCCYIARYAIESWGIIYLTEAKGYSTIGASGVLGVMQFAGIFGALTCGLVSDKFFNHKRNMPALIYGVLYAAAIAAFLWAPANPTTDMLSMCVYGFTMGALVCYLGGLMAVDICPKRATGAAMGMIGLLSYFGAALQEVVSGYLINAHLTIVNGKKIYDFALASDFWVGSAVLSFLLAAMVWNVKAHD
ncbi:glycerol-3-phosphate transporter [Sporomusaceae bacterium FL31]|nr:glycerol-3-phosphate transporter [Sporomusaceae bacterium FL31]GCE36009.1 glycerol-3-phosphate transporter [Sporomusaceae bacterium]